MFPAVQTFRMVLLVGFTKSRRHVSHLRHSTPFGEVMIELTPQAIAMGWLERRL